MVDSNDNSMKRSGNGQMGIIDSEYAMHSFKVVFNRNRCSEKCSLIGYIIILANLFYHRFPTSITVHHIYPYSCNEFRKRSFGF